MQKVALVTGAYQGIGKAIADTLTNNGFAVIYSDVHNGMDGVAYYHKCDISRAEDRASLLSYVEQNFGRLDILINNAGVACKNRLDILQTTEESFDRVVGINTKGTFFMCQTFANYMIKKLQSIPDYAPKMLNISSNSGYTSSVSRGEYCISKAGVSMTTALFADKLGEYGIPVLEIRPGIIKTPMTDVVTAKYDNLIFNEGITPLRRWGTPQDVANAALAVATGLLDFSTGMAIDVDGGFRLKRL